MTVISLVARILFDIQATAVLRLLQGWALEAHRKDKVRRTVLHCRQDVEWCEGKTEVDEVPVEVIEDALFVQ